MRLWIAAIAVLAFGGLLSQSGLLARAGHTYNAHPHIRSVADATAYVSRRSETAPGTVVCESAVKGWSYVCRFQWLGDGLTAYLAIMVGSNGDEQMERFFGGDPHAPAVVTPPSVGP